MVYEAPLPHLCFLSLLVCFSHVLSLLLASVWCYEVFQLAQADDSALLFWGRIWASQLGRAVPPLWEDPVGSSAQRFRCR